MSAVGSKIPHESAVGHVTGEALFLDDLPHAHDELVVDFLTSPVAHGILRGHNFEELRKMEGIAGIYTYQDLPGRNLFGGIIADEPFLAEDRVEYVGQPIAVIAAEDLETVHKARKKARFVIDSLPPVFTIEEAIEANRFIGVPRKIIRGDFQHAWQNAEHRLEGVFRCNGQEHFYLESQAAIACPGEENQIHIHASTQNPTEIQQVVAEALGLGFQQVICVCKRMGGGFGGKETQSAIPSVMAALAAHKTGRPARVAYSKDDDMRSTGKRHPFLIRYLAAFSSKGLITGVKLNLYSNGGAAADLSTAIMERAMLHSDNAYYIPNIEIHGAVCRTNLPPNTALRGFGGPQGMANIENLIQEIAGHLKMDAYEVRRLNCYGHEERIVTPYGQVVRDHLLPEMMEQLAGKTNYHSRLTEIEEFNRGSQTHLRGLALTPIKFGISFTTSFLNQGNALVNVFLDGTVQVSTGGTEMGQGLNTKIRQIVADELGVAFDSVLLMITSTEKNNNTSPTAASAGTDLNGMAAEQACRKIRERLVNVASRMLASPETGLEPSTSRVRLENGVVWDERARENKIGFARLVRQAWMERVSLGERGFYSTPGVEYDRETGKGTPFYYYTNGAAVAEVKIDRFTGELNLERADLLMDIGESINPGIDLGQTIGGFVQGMGWLTTEELRYSDCGELLSYSPTTYKIPNVSNLPERFTVEYIQNPKHKINIHRSKAIGEPPLMLSLSVWMAVKHALSTLAKDRVSTLNIPATGEEILRRITELDAGKVFSTAECEIPLIPSSATGAPETSSREAA